MACCLHGLQKPQDLARIRAGKFDSPKAINTAKNVIPPFGQLYGFLTETFVHMGPLNHSIQPLMLYEKRDDDLLVNLRVIKTAVWLFYVITEFAFLDLNRKPRYCHSEPPDKAVYNPSETERQWQGKFFNGPNAD